jgi:hypothetical protein
MDNAQLFQSLGLSLDADAYTLGAPQQSGPMSVLPVFGPDAGQAFAPPLSGLKLGGVKRGYGNVELSNGMPGVAIVPLHMGYIQDGAQNHALCRSAFLGPGQNVVFEDACCVQQAQGGFLADREQWFFVLPLALREEALALRGTKAFGKLWPAIAALSARLGFDNRGHLEQVICRRRPFLTQYQSRFELLDGQTGALFFLRDRLVGVELAPSADYFREVWFPLLCFCYGTAAMELEQRDGQAEVVRRAGRKALRAEPALVGAGVSDVRDVGDVVVEDGPEPFPAKDLADLRRCLADARWERQRRLREPLLAAKPERYDLREEERYLGLRLLTAVGQNLAGQVVQEDGPTGRTVYASLTARAAVLRGLN